MIRYHARFVLPVGAPVITGGTVCVEGDRIAYVGSRDGAPAGTDVELGDAVLMPGLVNVHTHLELTVLRGFLEDLAFRPWIVRLTTSRRDVLSVDDRRDSANVGIAEGLLAGITTYADTSDSGQSLEAMRDRGVRGIVYQEATAPDPAEAPAAFDALLRSITHWRPRETTLVRLGVSPHAPYSVSDLLFEATARYAREEGLRVAVHIAESEDESRFVVAGEGSFADNHRSRGIPVVRRGASPVRLLERTSVLDTRPLLIHCVRVDASDIATIRAHGCSVAHCPASNAKLGHGTAPAVEMIAAGIPVGLGSDSVAANNRMDLLDEARLAALMQRARLGSPDALPARQLLEMGTIGGARALGLEGDIGSLEVGKQADLAAFSLDGAADSPVFDPADALVFGQPGRRASLVVVAGRVLVRDGALLEPPADASRRLNDAARRLQEWSQRVSGNPPRRAVVPPPIIPPASTETV